MRKDDRPTVLVTGASSGIGRAVSRVYAQNGWLTINVGRNRERLEQLSRENPLASSYFVCDMQKASDIKALCAYVQERREQGVLGPIKTLVNNAAIYKSGSFTETTAADWDEQYRTNLLGPVQLIQGLLPFLKDAGGAWIVNVSSTLGVKPVAGTLAYSALKAALNNLTLGLALELAPHQIRVNAICPGLVDTPIHGFHGQPDSSPDRQRAHAMQPLGRMGTPEEIAQWIFQMGSPAATWMTGSVVVVDGGISL